MLPEKLNAKPWGQRVQLLLDDKRNAVFEQKEYTIRLFKQTNVCVCVCVCGECK